MHSVIINFVFFSSFRFFTVKEAISKNVADPSGKRRNRNLKSKADPASTNITQDILRARGRIFGDG